jgi:3-deoxy-7-phosphoheptulonate synthase
MTVTSHDRVEPGALKRAPRLAPTTTINSAFAKPDDAGAGTAVAVIAPEATERDVRLLVESVRTRGYQASVYDVGPGVIVLPGLRPSEVEAFIGGNRAVERVFVPDTRYRLVRREVRPPGSVVEVGGVPFGGEDFPVIAGPCAVESEAQIREAARQAAAAGAAVLRGGAFKPRTSPYNFQGLGLHGVELLASAGREAGLPVVTEIMDPSAIEDMYPLVDCFQVGARNMQNFELLRALGDLDKPVLLKRGPSATLEEWLLAAEYMLIGGNDNVILCERGIRTFNVDTRYTLDLATVALAKRETHLPVIVDPSHATGDPALVTPMALAAMAAGADGVMIEAHPDPATALSDGLQALRAEALREVVLALKALAPATGRRVSSHRSPIRQGV